MPILKGKSISLCPFDPEALEDFVRWNQNREYMELQTSEALLPRSADSIKGSVQHWAADDENIVFLIKKMDRYIGFTSIVDLEWNNRCAELVIAIGDVGDRGQGHGRESMELILDYAFGELNLHRVSLTVLGFNERAIGLYEKLGFQREGTLREFGLRGGKRYDLLYYGMLAREWRNEK